jgi:hypothetical protein
MIPPPLVNYSIYSLNDSSIGIKYFGGRQDYIYCYNDIPPDIGFIQTIKGMGV